MEVISWLSYFFSSRHARSVVRVYFIVMLRPSKLNYQILIPARTNFDDLRNLYCNAHTSKSAESAFRMKSSF